MNRSLVAVLALCVPLLAGSAFAQDLSLYRGVHLGDGVDAVIASTGARMADVRIVHERPALMQELEWRLRSLGGSTSTTDPVRRVVFSFYNDGLYRVCVTYEPTQINGLTDADLIESLSVVYGTPVTSETVTALRPSESPDRDAQGLRVVARWENAESSVALVRGTYLAPLSLVILAKRVAGDARSADQEAVRLDVSERPAREAAKARQDASAAQLAEEKARPVNKKAFKP
jgi:hypothetical protein